MKQKRGTQRALTTDAALAALADLWLWDPSFMVGTRIEKENRLKVAWQKLLADNTEFSRTTDGSKEWDQFKKLRWFHQQATFGTALGNNERRSRVKSFLDDWQIFRLTRGNKQMRTSDSDAGIYLRHLGPILEALSNEDDEFFSDLAIAIRFAKKPFTANAFLARYSLLTAGRQPTLTFGEIQKILGSSRHDLRKKIKDLRKKYGEAAVPLKFGKPGRPRKKSTPPEKIGG